MKIRSLKNQVFQLKEEDVTEAIMKIVKFLNSGQMFSFQTKKYTLIISLLFSLLKSIEILVQLDCRKTSANGSYYPDWDRKRTEKYNIFKTQTNLMLSCSWTYSVP